jgi:small nuclear ribonucleoprotein (snRNP)-like protein
VSIAALAACLCAEAALGQPALPPRTVGPAEAGKRPWGPEQATGAPDTMEAGDKTTAWAPAEPDGGPEWLRLGYGKAVHVAEVRIRETCKPGGVCRVTAIPAAGREVTLWEGDDPTLEAPGEFVVQPRQDVEAASIQVYLDTRKTEGWDEIDAVELVGKDGSRQWATSAEASSTYADRTRSGFSRLARPSPEGPMGDADGDLFRVLLHRPVTVHLEGQATVQGTLLAVSDGALQLDDPAGNRKIVNRAKVLFAESPRAAATELMREKAPEEVPGTGGDLFRALLHRAFTVHLEDQTTVRGLVVAVAGQALQLEDVVGKRTIVIDRAKVLFAEARPQE